MQMYMKKETTKKEKTSSDIQKLSEIKGRAMLEWYAKRAPRSIEWFPAQEKEMYGAKLIKERHRHRFEVNPAYLDQYSKHGFNVSGRNPETNLIEIMELDRNIHPYFIGTQAHPEFKSRLQFPSPLFKGLVSAALKYSQENVKLNSK
jgi:CTP synthase (UTP-ammonia lyase)